MDWQAAPDRYDGVEYARAGASGLTLPRLSLGLWNNFGDDRSFAVQRAIVLRAFDRGVTQFDLANNYGPPVGAAERTFGRILATDLRAHRDELVVTTKAGYEMGVGPYQDNGSRKHLLASLDASLARLGLPHVDVFYSHRFDPATPLEETMGAVSTAVQRGKAVYAGVSNHGPDETRRAAALLSAAGTPLVLQQPSYSMFDREAEALFPVLDELGVGAVVYSPLAQGLLTDRYLGGSLPAGSRAAEGRWLEPAPPGARYLERVRGLQRIAADGGRTLAQLALAWVMRVPQVTSAIIGASSVAQLDANLDAVAQPPLSDAEVAAIAPLAVDGTGLQD